MLLKLYYDIEWMLSKLYNDNGWMLEKVYTTFKKGYKQMLLKLYYNIKWMLLKLMGSLQPHVSRINKSLEMNEEKVFQVKAESPIQNKRQGTFQGRGTQGTQGYGRGTFQGRECGRGRSQYGRDRGSQYERGRGRNGVQCYQCHRFSHIEANCWEKCNQASYARE